MSQTFRCWGDSICDGDSKPPKHFCKCLSVKKFITVTYKWIDSAHCKVAAGLDGRIWVQLSVPSEEFEPAPPRGDATHRPPPVKFRPRDQQWDVFEANGQYVGRVGAPSSVSLYGRRGNQVWGLMRDENDVASIVRMRIDPGW